jgi:hypothetical protein
MLTEILTKPFGVADDAGVQAEVRSRNKITEVMDFFNI